MFRSLKPDAVDPPVVDFLTDSVSDTDKVASADGSFTQIDFEIVGHKLSYSNVESVSDDILSVAAPTQPIDPQETYPDSPSFKEGAASPTLSVQVGDLSGSILEDLPDDDSVDAVAEAPTAHSPVVVQTILNDWDDHSASVREDPLLLSDEQGCLPSEVVLVQCFHETLSLGDDDVDVDEEKEEDEVREYSVDPSLYQIVPENRASLEQKKLLAEAIGLNRPPRPMVKPSDEHEPVVESSFVRRMKFIFFFTVAALVMMLLAAGILNAWKPEQPIVSQPVPFHNETSFPVHETNGSIPTTVLSPYTAPTIGQSPEPNVEALVNSNQEPGLTPNTLGDIITGVATNAASLVAEVVNDVAPQLLKTTDIGKQILEGASQLHRVAGVGKNACSWIRAVWDGVQNFLCIVAAVGTMCVICRVLSWCDNGTPLQPIEPQLDENKGSSPRMTSTPVAMPKQEYPSRRSPVIPKKEGKATIPNTLPWYLGSSVVKPTSSVHVHIAGRGSGCVDRTDDFINFLRSCQDQLSHNGRPSRVASTGCRTQLGYNLAAYECLTKDDLAVIAKHFALGAFATTDNKANLIARVVTAYESMLEGYTMPALKKVLAVNDLKYSPNAHKNDLVKLAVEAAF